MFFDVGEYSKTLELSIPDDSDYQASAGNISLTLASGTASALGETIRADIMVLDNLDAGRIGFRNSSVDANTQTARIYLSRDRGSAGTVMARLVSAVSGFLVGTTFSTTVAFEPGEMLTFIDISLRPTDEYVVGSFELSLLNATGGAVLGLTSTTVNVQDDQGVSFPGSTKLATNAVTGGTIDFVWTDPLFIGGPTAFIVQYQLDLLTPNGSVQSYNVSGGNMLHVSHLRCESAYKARIATVNQRGRGSFSDYTTVSTTAPTNPGPVRELRSVQVTGGYAELGWQEPLDFGGRDIALYRISFEEPSDVSVRTVEVNGSMLTASIGGLLAQSVYEFAVMAVNTADIVGAETSVSLQTMIMTAPDTPPKPALIRATGGALHFNVLASLDTGGAELVEYTVYVARLTGWDVQYCEFVTRHIIENKPVSGVIGNESMYDLLAESTYYVKVSVTSQYVGVLRVAYVGGAA